MLSRPLRLAARVCRLSKASSTSRDSSLSSVKANPLSFSQPRRNMNSRSAVPYPPNEPIYEYRKGSLERIALEKAIAELRSQVHEVPLIIGGKEIKTGQFGEQTIPHEHNHVLARFAIAGEAETKLAIEAALKARREWAAMPLDHRAAVFLKAAELLTGPWRSKMSAATILGQSKNFFQAEIDCICELADFWRYNARYAQDILSPQPHSSKGVWNRLEYRPLEGFIYAVSPFNFTAIGGNLPSAPAVLGNVVVWKPADNAMLSNYYIMKILEEAGMPPGVINFVPGFPVPITNTLLADQHFAGLHFTGSTVVFKQLWKQIAANIDTYKTYPRIVGETGGKDFVFVHHSADPIAVATGIVRGAFEFAGQKCSAASRGYISASLWPKIWESMKSQLSRVKMGNPEEQDTLVNAVIHKNAFARCASYIEYAKTSPGHEIIHGGKVDDSVGYFVEPTVIVTTDPNSRLLREEIFGPIFTLYVYDDAKFTETLELCNTTAEYALTGCVFARDRQAIVAAEAALSEAAGNFYINDKPTGAVVGQQPFGGARGSGTNDKAGSHLNLLRWVSPRTIKETFAPPTDFSYPYMTSQ